MQIKTRHLAWLSSEYPGGFLIMGQKRGAIPFIVTVLGVLILFVELF